MICGVLGNGFRILEEILASKRCDLCPPPCGDLIAGMTEPQVIEAYRQVMGAWPSQSLEGLPA
jgi:hypothetical protein